MPKTNYTCEFCGKSFENDYNACSIHEKEMHVKPSYSGIEPHYDIDKKYPNEIVVTFDNGAMMAFGANPSTLMEPIKEESPLPQIEDSLEKPFDF